MFVKIVAIKLSVQLCRFFMSIRNNIFVIGYIRLCCRNVNEKFIRQYIEHFIFCLHRHHADLWFKHLTKVYNIKIFYKIACINANF